jgi:hypothetical protein
MTPKHNQSAVHRRARQNKHSGKQGGMLDATTSRGVMKSWSVVAQPRPNSGLTRMENRPYNLYQTVDFGVVTTTSGSAEVDGASALNLSQLAQVSTLQALFDQYRLVEVECWLTPTYQNYVGGNSAARYAVAIDYDNSNTVAFANLLQYANVQDVSANCGAYARFKPHTTLTSVTNSSSANIANLWIDSAVGGQNWFGLKWACPATSVTYTLNLTIRYHFQFRNVI